MKIRFIYFAVIVVLNGYLCYDLAITNSFSLAVFGLSFDFSKTTSLENNITSNLNNNNSISYYFNLNYFSNSSLVTNNSTITNEFAKTKVALVKPVFTDAAYDNKFYIFYKKYASVLPHVNITTDIDLLNSMITNYQAGTVNNVFAMLDLISAMKWINNKTSINTLDDVAVHNGRIFADYPNNRSNSYDVLILGHQEYVTQLEYNNLKQFVLNGGTMIVLDGNVFYAEVKYDHKNNTISLVKGHGWAFNGKSAWKSVLERWPNETKDWVGSNYFCYLCVKGFKNDPFNYFPHEEQQITNPKDVILLSYNPFGIQGHFNKNATVATYELNYGKGKTIAIGIYSDDIIKNRQFDRFFDSLIIKYGLHIDTAKR